MDDFHLCRQIHSSKSSVFMLFRLGSFAWHRLGLVREEHQSCRLLHRSYETVNFKISRFWNHRSWKAEMHRKNLCLSPMHAVANAHQRLSPLSHSFGLTFYFFEKNSKDAFYGCMWSLHACSLSQMTEWGDIQIMYWVPHTVTSVELPPSPVISPRVPTMKLWR